MRRLAAALAVLAAALLLPVTQPAPAQARVAMHPFGDPQTVEVGRAGEVVRVRYRIGMADDFTLLGIHLGVLPEDRVMLDGAVNYEEGDQEELEGSPELRDYLLEQIEVSTGGAACDGEVVAVEHLIEDGATLDFTCPTAPESAEVTVRMLTDLHPAYRTLAVGPDGQRAVFGSASETHEWTLPDGTAPAAPAGSATDVPAGSDAAATSSATSGDEGDESSTDGSDAATDLEQSAALQMGAVVGVVVLLLLAGALGLRRLRNT